MNAFREWLSYLLHQAGVRWSYTMQRMFDCEYVGLVEIVRSGESFALVRSPTYRWFWSARLWVAIISFAERDADQLHRRIVLPSRADTLEEGYQQWAANGRKFEKHTSRINRWARNLMERRARAYHVVH